MPDPTIPSPNMNLPIPIVGQTQGPDYALNVDACLLRIDGHTHLPGFGVPITTGAININADLSFSGFNLTTLRSLRFSPQLSALSGPADLGCLYEAGVDLWYNDGNGNQVQLTAGGTVNATSSGISSGTATASFVSSVLVVNAAANTPANIQGASLLMGNNVANSKYLTLSPPSAMAANYNLVLPSLPSVTSIMALDTAGNITAPYTVDGSTIVISSNVIQVPAGGITSTQLASNSVGTSQLQNSSVSTAKLQDASVTRNKLAADGVVAHSGKFSVTGLSVTTSPTTLATISSQVYDGRFSFLIQVLPAIDGSISQMFSSSPGTGFIFQLVNSSTGVIAQWTKAFVTGEITFLPLTAYNVPTGTVSYTLQIKTVSGTGTITLDNFDLFAIQIA